MYDRAGPKSHGWKPHNYSDYDSGSESHPLMSSDASQTSRRSFGTTTFMFPDSETSDFESNPAKPVMTLVPSPRPRPLELYNASRRPFVYHANNLRKNDSSWEDQMSAITYNRFQYYSKLRTYALDDSALVIPNHVLPFTYFVPYISGSESKGDGKQGSLVTIFAVWNTIMGSSLLTMPWGVQNSGLLMGIVTIVMMGGLCLSTTHKILQVQMRHGKANSDGEVAELATLLLGRWAGYIAKLFSLLVLLGAVIVYWVLMSNFLYHSVDYIYETVTLTTSSEVNSSMTTPSVLCPRDETDGDIILNATLQLERPKSIYNKVWDLTTTVPIFLILIIGPLINFRSVTFFTKFNSLGTLSVMYTLLFVIIKSATFGINVDFINVTNIHFTPLFQATFPALSGMAALSFFIHNIIITIMRNNRNQENNTRDLSIAYLLVTLTYAFIGILFYVCFPLDKICISDNLLDNFQNWDPMTVIARVFLFFQLITVYPLIAFMLRSQFFMAVTGDVYPGLPHVLGFNTFVVIVCVLFAIFIPSIGTIIRYTGALCGLLYIFTLPILLHLASQRACGKTSLISTILHLSIPVIGAINLLAQFFV
ncbi:sodium-coupled neutral amino acid transporter 9-like [Zootermopsis nevadensis]|uniref:Putative amino acid permease F13H10.3 n=1 Tax=Zootermopsis nevadensis TaxID=136037 RepID=A0A067R137_ZOONE|nr:sodium-coupled neutral amino acid transporter 9-like [Zootermopsis nevadensis]KDR15632.1 Putative amino acid permease F13H10.3 [Zootermopsis nevadensis]